MYIDISAFIPRGTCRSSDSSGSNNEGRANVVGVGEC